MVEIGNGAAALLTVNLDAAFSGRKCREIPAPVSPQAEALARVVAGGLRFRAEKVLRQEKVFVPVSVKVGDTDTEHGRELSLDRERPWFEMITTIEEEHRVEGRHLQMFHPPASFAQDLIDVRETVCGEAWKSLEQPRHCLA